MYRSLLCVTLALACLSPALRAQAGNEYGLRFVSHEDIKDNRTSLVLTPHEKMRLDDDFTISFDVRFHNALHTFGYVFRMVDDEEASFDMISDLSTAEPQVRFVRGQNTIAEFALTNPVFDKWMSVTLEVDSGAGTITISVDAARLSVPLSLSGKRYGIWFGMCDHTSYYTTDVPPMSLRDVKILNGRNNLLRHWELGRHDGDIAWDVSGKHPATANNPVWMLDGYARWRKRTSALVPEEYLGMAARSDGSAIHFAAGSHLAVYDNSRPDMLEVKETQGPMPFAVQPNQIVFDDAAGLVVAYEFESRRTATLDPAAPNTPWWSESDVTVPVTRYGQHNAAYIPLSGKIVTFGGYGEHTYKSRMNVIDPDGEWQTFELAEKLPPRYLSGMAVMDDGELVIVGGYGSRSGLQSEAPHNFYDIWRVDPVSGRVDSVGRLTHGHDDEPFVMGRDMVPSSDGKRVFALVYSDKRYASEIQLVGIEIATGNLVRYADTVPYQFSDDGSLCTLVYDEAREEFLLVAMSRQGGEGTLVEIWALDAPPLRIADTVHTVRRGGGFPWWIVGIVLMSLLVAGGLWAALRLGRRKGQSDSGEEIHIWDVFPDPDAPPSIAPDYYKTYRVEKRPSSILLLGGFQVVDKNGKDITGQFTQTVRALFLLILLETYKNGRGISSQVLGDTLWFDKDPENARNNRNVNVHKLRMLLAEVGEADISSKNSYWHLKLGDGIFCDYGTLLSLKGDIEREGVEDPARAAGLVALARLGKLLPETQTEWSDGYKADFSSRLIELLMKTASVASLKRDPHLLLGIADAVLTHDNLDEDAMRMKCSALVKMGKKNQARQTYNAFVADFKKTLEIEPDFDFTDILGE